MPRIEKTPSGKYTTLVYVGKDRNGKRIMKRFTHPDKRTLRRIASEYVDEHRAQLDTYFLSDALNDFLSAKSSILSPSTLRSYQSMTNMLNRRYSSFCSLGIDRIDSHNFQKLIDDLSTLGRSPKYIRNIHGLISAVLTSNDTAVPKVRLPEKNLRRYTNPPRMISVGRSRPLPAHA